MPIYELVIGTLKPEVAKQGFSAIRTGVPTVFKTVPGCVSNHLGHVLTLDGNDVSSQYKPILALEWNDIFDFHAFYPSSEAFQAFAGIFGPYAAAKARPQLFEPAMNSSHFSDVFSRRAAQIFVVTSANERKDDVTGAWGKLLEAVNNDADVAQWSGWGIDEDEGTWVGIVGWKGSEEIGRGAGVTEAINQLIALSKAKEYLVLFE